MSVRRSIHAFLTALAMWLPTVAHGALSISTTVSKTGSYTVSWTVTSNIKTRKLYLHEEVNAGTWSGPEASPQMRPKISRNTRWARIISSNLDISGWARSCFMLGRAA